MASNIANYYQLTKPGIIYGNLLTAAGGFFFATRGHLSPELLLATLVGLALIVASGCVFNNVIDRGIDAQMARTRTRALVMKTISPLKAICFATILGLTGLATLLLFTNVLTALMAMSGFFLYVVVYGVAKRRTVYGTEVGSLSGAIPPVVGYVAVTGQLDITALVLFSILVAWQMPHFYAIAIYRLQDYQAAGIPVLPAVRGIARTRRGIIVYIVAYLLAVFALSIVSYAGPAYLVVSLLIGTGWLVLGLRGFSEQAAAIWARRMFRYSLLVITLLCVSLSVDAALR